MVINAENTHQKYSVKGWDFFRSHEYSYLPDNIIDRVLNIVKPYIQQALSIPEQYSSFNAPDTLAYPASMEEALKQTQDTLSSLSSRFDNAVKIADKAGDLIISPSKITHGQGYCKDHRLVWEFDHSINNIIYFAHEFGHRVGNIGHDTPSPWNITEWQSHFVHLTQLERLIDDKIMGNDAANVATIHRHLEIYQNLKQLNSGLNAVKKLNDNNFKIEDKNNLERQASGIHYHPTAIFITMALREKFKTTSEYKKEQMLHSLYQQGKYATPETILSAFNLNHKDELEQHIHQALNAISFNAGKNLRPRPQQALKYI